jgi:hypothetical protein
MSYFSDEPTIEAVEDAHSLLKSVYQNPAVPLSVRMKAASIAIEYERPSLKATAIVPMGGDFAARLERAIERSNGGSRLPATQLKTIEHAPAELRPGPTSATERRQFIPRRRVP